MQRRNATTKPHNARFNAFSRLAHWILVTCFVNLEDPPLGLKKNTQTPAKLLCKSKSVQTIIWFEAEYFRKCAVFGATLTSFLGLPLRFPPEDGAAAAFCEQKWHKVRHSAAISHLQFFLYFLSGGTVPWAACRWQSHFYNDRRKRGIGFIGYYLEGRQELHTGHSSSPATWSEAQRQLVKSSGDAKTPLCSAGAAPKAIAVPQTLSA